MSSEFAMLQYEDIPCWYDLSFDFTKPALMLNVHEDFLSKVSIPNEAPIINIMMQDYGFTSFAADLSGKEFGFNGAFKSVGIKEQFAIFSIDIPLFEKPVMKRCEACQGNGNTMFEALCPVCKGTKQERKYIPCTFCEGDNYPHCHRCAGGGKELVVDSQRHLFYEISATLAVFFQIMRQGIYTGQHTTCSFHQLLEVETSIRKEMNGAPLSGIYSIPLVNWLAGFSPNTHLSKVEKAMTCAHRKIFGKNSDLEKRDIWAALGSGNGWLNISVPGDRCGIHPTHSSYSLVNRGIQGYEFSCHNVDTPMQQLILLCGLAALCDMARKARVGFFQPTAYQHI